MYKNRHDDSKLANLISQKFPYIIKDIQENDNYIFITLQQTGKNFEHLNIIYDKTKCKTYEFKPKNEGVVWNNWNDYLSQQYYTTFISAIEKEYINYKHLNEGNKIIYNKVGENDNPIIIKYKLQ